MTNPTDPTDDHVEKIKAKWLTLTDTEKLDYLLKGYLNLCKVSERVTHNMTGRICKLEGRVERIEKALYRPPVSKEGGDLNA